MKNLAMLAYEKKYTDFKEIYYKMLVDNISKNPTFKKYSDEIQKLRYERDIINKMMEE